MLQQTVAVVFADCRVTGTACCCFVTLQIERYNLLLDLIRKQLTELEKGIQGLVVMSADLEEIFNCVYDARVPAQWMKVRLSGRSVDEGTLEHPFSILIHSLVFAQCTTMGLTLGLNVSLLVAYPGLPVHEAAGLVDT